MRDLEELCRSIRMCLRRPDIGATERHELRNKFIAYERGHSCTEIAHAILARNRFLLDRFELLGVAAREHRPHRAGVRCSLGACFSVTDVP